MFFYLRWNFFCRTFLVSMSYSTKKVATDNVLAALAFIWRNVFTILQKFNIHSPFMSLVVLIFFSTLFHCQHGNTLLNKINYFPEWRLEKWRTKTSVTIKEMRPFSLSTRIVYLYSTKAQSDVLIILWQSNWNVLSRFLQILQQFSERIFMVMYS